MCIFCLLTLRHWENGRTWSSHNSAKRTRQQCKRHSWTRWQWESFCGQNCQRCCPRNRRRPSCRWIWLSWAIPWFPYSNPNHTGPMAIWMTSKWRPSPPMCWPGHRWPAICSGTCHSRTTRWHVQSWRLWGGSVAVAAPYCGACQRAHRVRYRRRRRRQHRHVLRPAVCHCYWIPARSRDCLPQIDTPAACCPCPVSTVEWSHGYRYAYSNCYSNRLGLLSCCWGCLLLRCQRWQRLGLRCSDCSLVVGQLLHYRLSGRKNINKLDC